MAANVIYYAMGKSGSFGVLSDSLMRIKIQMKMQSSKWTTYTKFGVKMFIRAQDTAANVMYYAIGGSYVGGLPN